MNNIQSLKTYTPLSSDVFFFDNNVWILLFCPIGNVDIKLQNIYSKFLQQVDQRKCTIFINSLILSEFANRYLRFDYNFWVKSAANVGKDFKRDYTVTKRFSDTSNEVKLAINKIMTFSQKCNDEFTYSNFNNIISNFGKVDFNDSYYVELCSKKNW
jgi:hypothetical protein